MSKISAGFQRLERLLLYVIVILLAAMLAYLILRDGGGGSGEIIERLDQIIGTQEEHGEYMAAIITELGEMEGRLDSQLAKISAELVQVREGTEAIQEVTTDIQATLVGVESRTAQAVCERLNPELCTDAPPPCTTVDSNFTLLFENARLDDDGKVSEQSMGIQLTRAHEQRLDAIVRAFGPCRGGEHKVEFSIHGYSSTADFQARDGELVEPLPETDQYNLDTARLRAEVVANYLRNKEFLAEIKEPRDDDPEAMARPYVDDAISGETDQEALNRSVFIEVMDAGACKRKAQ